MERSFAEQVRSDAFGARVGLINTVFGGDVQNVQILSAKGAGQRILLGSSTLANISPVWGFQPPTQRPLVMQHTQSIPSLSIVMPSGSPISTGTSTTVFRLTTLGAVVIVKCVHCLELGIDVVQGLFVPGEEQVHWKLSLPKHGVEYKIGGYPVQESGSVLILGAPPTNVRQGHSRHR